jgi:hypothetical protein
MALIVRSNIQLSGWSYSADNRKCELHWVRVGNTFVAALYHPPAPVYNQKDLLDYIEACVAQLGRDFPAASIVLAGDLNQQTDQDLEERRGLTQIVHQRVRGNSILDRVYSPTHSCILSSVSCHSVVKIDHRAVVVYADKTALEGRKHCPANVPA